MNPLQQAINDKVLEPALKQRLHTVKAKIIDFDNINNLAVVEMRNPYGAGTKTIAGVPVQITGGQHQAGPFIGDEVWINFIGGSEFYPRIVSLADENYVSKTRERLKHSRKGAYIPKSYMR